MSATVSRLIGGDFNVSRFIGEDFHVLNMVLGSQLWEALLEQGIGPDNLQRSLPISTILPFCHYYIWINL